MKKKLAFGVKNPKVDSVFFKDFMVKNSPTDEKTENLMLKSKNLSALDLTRKAFIDYFFK